MYTPLLRTNLDRIAGDILPKVRNWSTAGSLVSCMQPKPNQFFSIGFLDFCFQAQTDLCDSEMAYGLLCRIVGIESAITLVQQFGQIRDYLEHLLAQNDHKVLATFFVETSAYLLDLRKPIYMCVAMRVIDLPGTLAASSKVKYDMSHVNVEVEHSAYINHINRVRIQVSKQKK